MKNTVLFPLHLGSLVVATFLVLKPSANIGADEIAQRLGSPDTTSTKAVSFSETAEELKSERHQPASRPQRAVSEIGLNGVNISGQDWNSDKREYSDLSSHVFPALGSPAVRKVSIEWNRFYDHKAIGTILQQLTNEFASLTTLSSIGKSYKGREIWCLEVTSKNHGNPKRKPAMYIDGNIHGNEVQGGEAVLYTAWYLCHQYHRLDKVTELLDQYTFYLIPTINPDGRDFWLHYANTSSTSRSGAIPVDNDLDGQADEDDYDDLNHDGVISQMRIKDPNGRWKPHPDFPDTIMIQAAPDEKGVYTLLGIEGIDNDNDGRINEDGVGGYDMNRDWAWDWQPRHIQSGAMDYPFFCPETRAVAKFIMEHPNIAAAQSYHNAGGMILRSPGREGGVMQPGDERVLSTISQRGEQILPFYRSMVINKDLYTVWGGEIDWLYGAQGILTFSNELWSKRNQTKSTNAVTQVDDAAFIRDVLLNEGAVKWQSFNHPTYGTIEIGGYKKEWGRTPPSFLLEEECHRNMAFTLFHASQMPQISIKDISTEKLGSGLFKIWVTVENTRTIPTRTDQDVRSHINAPDVVSISGPNISVLSAGRVTNPYFKTVEAVKRRPSRVELSSIGGLETVRVQFVVSGSGSFTVRLNSVKGGELSKDEFLQ